MNNVVWSMDFDDQYTSNYGDVVWKSHTGRWCASAVFDDPSKKVKVVDTRQEAMVYCEQLVERRVEHENY